MGIEVVFLVLFLLAVLFSVLAYTNRKRRKLFAFAAAASWFMIVTPLLLIWFHLGSD